MSYGKRAYILQENHLFPGKTSDFGGVFIERFRTAGHQGEAKWQEA
jgi:hypothetical protein